MLTMGATHNLATARSRDDRHRDPMMLRARGLLAAVLLLSAAAHGTSLVTGTRSRVARPRACVLLDTSPSSASSQPPPSGSPGGGADDRAAGAAAAAEADEPTSSSSKLATAIGLGGLAGGASVASTVATTAGGVCAGGACAAGAGALAAGGTGGAAAAAAAGGGVLAGAKVWLVGAGLVASGALSTMLGVPTLETMVQEATPLESAIGSGKPTVIEFYGRNCPHCREMARDLAQVERRAVHDDGFNWVMVDTDDMRMEPIWRIYRVDELPHFEFFNAKGDEVGWEAGVVPVPRIEERLTQAAARPAP